jgi:hypothetical protein
MVERRAHGDDSDSFLAGIFAAAFGKAEWRCWRCGRLSPREFPRKVRRSMQRRACGAIVGGVVLCVLLGGLVVLGIILVVNYRH